MRAGRSERRGITKRDVVVLLVLILTAVGVFFTFLPPAQESAARTECAMHLKHLGDAIHRYHTRTKTLPPSRIDGTHATWAVLIAPDLAHKAKDQPLAAWDLAQPYGAQPDAARRAQIPFYYCPARRNPPQTSNDAQAEPPGALGDYATSAGNGNPQRPWDGDDPDAALVPAEVLARKGQVVERWQSRTTFDSLRRGLAHTVLIGDKHVPAEAWGRVAEGDGSIYNGGHAASYLRVAGPGFGLAPTPASPFNRNFGSSHEGGVSQFLMAENNLRTFTPKVDPEILGRLMTRDLPPGWDKQPKKN